MKELLSIERRKKFGKFVINDLTPEEKYNLQSSIFPEDVKLIK